MRCYQLNVNDQKHVNWLMFDRRKEPPFVQLKAKYKDLCCSRCQMYDHDLVFERGFESGIDLRVRGDIVGSEDGFLCFSEKAKDVIENNNIQGIHLKALPNQEWFAAKITCLVEADRTVYVFNRNICAECGRPKGTTGMIYSESQIKCPAKPITFFAPVFPRIGMMICHRDVFVTEDVVLALKQAGVKGAYFERLRSEEEDSQFKSAMERKADYKQPKGAMIYL